MSYQIFSDGACDMPQAFIEKYQIKLIPFYVSLDGETYQKEIEELSLDNFYKGVIGDHIYPKTSLPSVQDFLNAFTSALEKGEDILCYTITETLSSSFQSATTAKLMLEETYPKAKIYIVNSWLATGAQTLMLLQVGRMREAGVDIDTAYEISMKLRETGRIMFMVGTLDYLQKGGRIGKLAALSGNILSIKPLIELKGGEINVAGVARSRKKGLKKLSDITKAYFEKEKENPLEYNFLMGSTNLHEELPAFRDMALENLPGVHFEDDFQIGATIATHTGPDTTGLCFIKNYEAFL